MSVMKNVVTYVRENKKAVLTKALIVAGSVAGTLLVTHLRDGEAPSDDAPLALDETLDDIGTPDTTL